MRLTKILITAITFTLVFFAFVPPTYAAGPCYCQKKDNSDANCRPADNVAGVCVYIMNTDSTVNCDIQFASGGKTADQVCEAKVQDFQNSLKTGSGNSAGSQANTPKSKFLPPCVFEKEVKGDCRDVTVFLVLMFNIITYLFSIIGGVALLYFVYGGFIMILSQGNSEKVAQGKGVIVAAVLGIIIAFSGYALVRFVGKVAGIDNEFMLESVSK